MPFVRLLIALSAGIVLQWYADVPLFISGFVFVIALFLYVSFYFLSPFRKFSLQWLQGISVLLMIMATGSLLCFIKNPHHQKDNYTAVYRNGDAIIATVNEGLLDKPKTYKANLAVNGIYHNKTYLPASGTIIAYFNKDSLDASLAYGTQVVFIKASQNIINSNNPGAFDYRRFLLFQGITAQVNLKSDEYKIVANDKGSSLKTFILHLQTYILHTIKTFIPNPKERGVAEALLIGYRNELDKQLVQSYANTGVVHIIAISGLHLGMIYGFILLLFSPYKRKKWYRFAMPLTAIFIIWMFTLLAGAVPSILRSAVTFTFIPLGILINRKTNQYNTLAASAFCLLVVNPYYLWDVGFQLSYTAVLSILLFVKPLHNLLYVKNKIMNNIWLSVCVTLAAQILTLPVILYNFHQFPALFLLTNLLVLFLSEIILFALLFLVIIGLLTPIADITGKVIQAMIWLMNSIIEYTENIPLSVWKNIKTDVAQAWLLYLFIILLVLWLLYRLPKLFVYSLMILVVLLTYTSIDVWQKSHQQKLIVYSVQKHSAIDIVTGRRALYLYDDKLPSDLTALSFTIKPAHTLYRINDTISSVLPGKNNLSFHVNNKTILLLSQPVPKDLLSHKIKADIVIITGNPKLYMSDVLTVIDCNIIIADNGTSTYKLKKWKEACDSLHIRFHSIAQQGAFTADL